MLYQIQGDNRGQRSLISVPTRTGEANAGTTLGRQSEKRRKALVLDALQLRGWGDINARAIGFVGTFWVGKGERIMLQELPLSLMLLGKLHA